MNLELCLPLHRKSAWHEANWSIAHLLKRYPSETARLKTTALEISGLFEGIFPILDQLCRRTCRFCPDPCCLKATIWYDVKDMLFMHLSGTKIPDAQILSGPGDVCRYVGPKGCLLERCARPFVCTAYLCPPQLSLLRKHPIEDKKVAESIRLIKSGRTLIENAFAAITGGGGNDNVCQSWDAKGKQAHRARGMTRADL